MAKNKKLKSIPKFKNENDERSFWATHDVVDYFDMSKAIKNPIFSNLKPSTKSISLRLPKYLLANIKQMANKNDVPYQSLMKIMLAEKIQEYQYRQPH